MVDRDSDVELDGGIGRHIAKDTRHNKFHRPVNGQDFSDRLLCAEKFERHLFG